MVSETLTSIDDLDWLPDLDELGEAESDKMTEELLRDSKGEEEKDENEANTVEEQPQTNSSGRPSW